MAQLPDCHRHKPVLIRVDGAGFSHPLINYLAAAGMQYAVGFPTTSAVRDARNWPWALALAQAFTRLRLPPLPD